jgi:spermidine synthase
MPEPADPDDFVKPFISETLGSKSLYFSISAIQSSMNLMQPDALVLAYSRTMMGFLLFNPAPSRIAMIGLGGGSLAKFCYRHLPQTAMDVVEINPHVVALRDAFLVPQDDNRFKVILGDGAAFVRQAPHRYDVLLLDGFDLRGLPASLSSKRFFEHCRAALQPGGILVANLHYRHAHFETCVARIRSVFKDGVQIVVEPDEDNATVFARKGADLAAPAKGRLRRPSTLSDLAWVQLDTAFAHIARSCR